MKMKDKECEGDDERWDGEKVQRMDVKMVK